MKSTILKQPVWPPVAVLARRRRFAVGVIQDRRPLRPARPSPGWVARAGDSQPQALSKSDRYHPTARLLVNPGEPGLVVVFTARVGSSKRTLPVPSSNAADRR